MRSTVRIAELFGDAPRAPLLHVSPEEFGDLVVERIEGSREIRDAVDDFLSHRQRRLAEAEAAGESTPESQLEEATDGRR